MGGVYFAECKVSPESQGIFSSPPPETKKEPKAAMSVVMVVFFDIAF